MPCNISFLALLFIELFIYGMSKNACNTNRPYNLPI